MKEDNEPNRRLNCMLEIFMVPRLGVGDVLYIYSAAACPCFSGAGGSMTTKTLLAMTSPPFRLLTAMPASHSAGQTRSAGPTPSPPGTTPATSSLEDLLSAPMMPFTLP